MDNHTSLRVTNISLDEDPKSAEAIEILLSGLPLATSLESEFVTYERLQQARVMPYGDQIPLSMT
ncbi:hypothetical protein GBA52_012442 [Prunus armeniaca]|nr:hypothetical protein GBA52_012442 [Prunus armeniaca]